jgi:rhamnose utilization protein RhaD (predicted bifunctional aldolase and dehydrogenase)
MKLSSQLAIPAQLKPLLELTERVGRDPLLTQASTGNSSAKLDGVLWIKASGKWMADALRDDILIPLDLAEITDCLRENIDPTERYPRASLETAMHAALPHRVVLHVHCVNTISWAVRTDAPMQLERRLNGLAWRWLPYVTSGLPLSQEIQRALSICSDTNVFVLGNHGLVVAGEDAETVETLLTDVRRRLTIRPRPAPAPDLAALFEICRDPHWIFPPDDGLHTFGTDVISQAVLEKGILYPCQAIFSGSKASEQFRTVNYRGPGNDRPGLYADQPFLVVKGRGVVVSRSMSPAELAMLSGLAQVVQRLYASSPLRYLTECEVAALFSHHLITTYAVAAAISGR